MAYFCEFSGITPRDAPESSLQSPSPPVWCNGVTKKKTARAETRAALWDWIDGEPSLSLVPMNTVFICRSRLMVVERVRARWCELPGRYRPRLLL
jgi:hypothetical protein